MGLRLQGSRLELAQTLLVVLPSFILFGYNQSGLGGLLSVESWVETFPEIDTVHTTGQQESRNSTVQVRNTRLFIAFMSLLIALFRESSSQHAHSALYLDPWPAPGSVIPSGDAEPSSSPHYSPGSAKSSNAQPSASLNSPSAASS